MGASASPTCCWVARPRDSQVPRQARGDLTPALAAGLDARVRTGRKRGVFVVGFVGWFATAVSALISATTLANRDPLPTRQEISCLGPHQGDRARSTIRRAYTASAIVAFNRATASPRAIRRPSPRSDDGRRRGPFQVRHGALPDRSTIARSRCVKLQIHPLPNSTLMSDDRRTHGAAIRRDVTRPLAGARWRRLRRHRLPRNE